MNTIRTLRIALLSAALLVGAVRPSPAQQTPATGGDSDLVGVVAGTENLSTLERAIRAAGLEETLRGSGPFTIMAPTDSAWNKLPPAAVEELLNDPDRLREVLLYHVVPGRVTSAQARTLSEARTVGGATLRLRATPGGLSVNNARVRQTDIEASNGVIHGIDTVLMPPQRVRK
ncbi:MAG: fasciclin domain-containing protein [Gemmatimonadota bacterium]|jgi:uncharacterized surface protein with fasciclin (FAS1) repeats|nr:fasciclin domain-containing protein [Gemmatimonadota bacterium]